VSWKNIALGELCEVLDSKRKPITKKDRTTGSYPYYGATGIVDYVGDFIFNEKLVLIGEDGAKWDSGDMTAFIADGEYWVNNHAHVIKPLRNRLLDEWIVYYFYYKDLKEFVTGLTVPKLNQGQLKTIPIPLPPLATQQIIVAKLDAIFAEIDTATASAEANANNARALFQSYLTEFFELEAKSNISLLGEVCNVIGGGTPSKANEDFYTGTIPWATVRDMNNDNLVVTDYKITEEAVRLSATNIIPSNNVVIATRVGLGKVCILNQDTAINQDLRGVIPKNKEILDINYLFLWFKFIAEKIIQAGRGATVQGVTLPFIKSLPIPVPTLVKQKNSVLKIQSIFNNTELAKNSYVAKINELAVLKQSILHKAFNGELVKD
jgi:type I restriction enzyme S subunit